MSRAKEAAGRRAAQFVEDGMTVGLGTGSTVYFTLVGLAERIQAEKLSIRGVPTSVDTYQKATEMEIPLVGLDEVERIDLTIDGDDEIDHRFRAIKGGGGALLREKVIAAASTRVIVIVDSSKLVPMLGKFALPVEVVPFATEFVRTRLAELGARVMHRTIAGTPALTDQSNHILDAALDEIPKPTEIAAAIAAIPGVVEHGLFLDEIDTIVIGRGDTVEVRHRNRH